MEMKVSHITEFNSKNSTYTKIVETDIANGSEQLFWKKESVRESVILDKARYLAPKEWACLLSQLNAIIEYNNTVPDPDEMVSVEGGLVTIFDIFPNDYINSNGIYLPGGTFFFRQKQEQGKYIYGYSGLVWRVGNPNIPKSYIELKKKEFTATNTVSLGRFPAPKAPAQEAPRVPAQEAPKAPAKSPPVPPQTDPAASNNELRKAYAQIGIKM